MMNEAFNEIYLFQVITSNHNHNNEKLEVILNLKKHIKKELVDLKKVPKYIEILIYAIEIQEQDILSAAFGVLSHLIKRVSMQDKDSEILKKNIYLLIPTILNGLIDSKPVTRNSAKKSLEAYWFCLPLEVERKINEIGLTHKNKKIVNQSIIWLIHLIKNVNVYFDINLFLPNLLKIFSLNDEESDYIESLEKLLCIYYNIKHNKAQKFILEKEMKNLNFSNKSIIRLLNIIENYSENLSEFNYFSSNFFQDSSFTSIKNNFEKNDSSVSNQTLKKDFRKNDKKSHENDSIITSYSLSNKDDEQIINLSYSSDSPSMDLKLQKIMKSLNYTIDESISAIDFRDSTDLINTFNSMISVFNNKESEFNWSLREKSIIKLRSILRGNSSSVYTKELVNCIRDFSDSICKTISSLRTTLSTHGCLFVKECSIILKDEFNSLVENFLPVLIKLCSATKHIASMNANTTISIIFLNISYHLKYLQRIFVSVNEKNIQPRSFSGLWLQIFILRFHNNFSFLSSTHGLEIIIKSLIKLLKDPNPIVRNSGKDAFWCFHLKFPNESQSILEKLESNVIKSIQKSKPTNDENLYPEIISQKLNLNKTRFPSRDLNVDRNKELNKQFLQKKFTKTSVRSFSDNSITSNKLLDNTSLDKNFKSVISKKSFKTLKHSLSKSNIYNDSNDSKLKNADLKVLNKHVTKDVDFEKNQIEISDLKIKKNDLIEFNDVVFDKQSDPILKFLSSNRADLITEGISLLKYAIFGGEELSPKVNSVLKTISIRQPSLLKPLFLSSDTLYKKCYVFFSSEDFFRISLILFDNIDESKVNLIVSVLDVNDIYESIIKLLSYILSTSNILDDSELVMQFIKYKIELTKKIVDFLLESFNEIPISDSFVLKLASVFFDLTLILKSTEVYDQFKILIKKLYAINPKLFSTELDLADKNTKEEIETVVGNSLSLSDNNISSFNCNNFSGIYDLTKVNYKDNLDFLSPIKLNSEFTMITPVINEIEEHSYSNQQNMNVDQFNSNNLEKIEPSNPKNDSELEMKCSLEKDDTINFKNSTNVCMNNKNELNVEINENDVYEPNQDNDIHIDTDMSDKNSQPINLKSVEHDTSSNINNIKLNFFDNNNVHFSEDEKNIDQPNRLVEDFAQVKITELSNKNFDQKNSLNDLIEKIEPFKNVSNKSKLVSIYEDSNILNDSNMTQLKWFDFQLAKFHNSNTINEIKCNKLNNKSFLSLMNNILINNNSYDYKINVKINDFIESERFKEVCNNIRVQKASENDFTYIFIHLQYFKKKYMNQHDFYYNEFLSNIEDCLLMFFNSNNFEIKSQIYNGLTLLKLLLNNKLHINFKKICEILMNLIDLNDEIFGLSFGLSEIFDELINGKVNFQEIFDYILDFINKNENKKTSLIIFCLQSLYKTLNSFKFNKSILSDKKLKKSLLKFINSDNNEIRKLIISIYAELFKLLSDNDLDNQKVTEKNSKNIMDDILLNLTLPQQKLIRYYASN